MESGAIPDSNITASTIKTGFEAWKARLNKNFCWMPEVDADTEFIEVTFASIKNRYCYSLTRCVKRRVLGDDFHFAVV